MSKNTENNKSNNKCYTCGATIGTTGNCTKCLKFNNLLRYYGAVQDVCKRPRV